MGEMATCETCGSTLAVNGKCPDCGGPPEEPEWLDGYGYQEDSKPAVRVYTGAGPVLQEPSHTRPCPGRRSERS
jgi:hypothetical protein